MLDNVRVNRPDANLSLSKRNLRQGIIDVVALAIKQKGLTEYIESPATSARKSNFDAHIKLTSLGKSKFQTSAVNPSKQIIHPDLSKLKITGESCPINFVNKKKFYEDFALIRLNEFLSEIKHS